MLKEKNYNIVKQKKIKRYKKNSIKSKMKKSLPFVSICTPTFNRRPFFPVLFECFKNQTYPKNRMEWIIVDDGTDKIGDLIDDANIPQISYFYLPQKKTLGAKRNFMHTKTKGDIIVYMDDDDYYPPERVFHAVEQLLSTPNALCAGSSELYVYFKHIQKMYQFGPYNEMHATAGTFAFKRELLNETKYDDDACIAEEKTFLKNYTVPFIQLDPFKTILVFSHIHNTFDKKKLLENTQMTIIKESDKTVEMFIKHKFEENIKNFFLKDIDILLEKYLPGIPEMKPDVLNKIKEIETARNEMMKQQIEPTQFMFQQPGKEPLPLTIQGAVNIIHLQQNRIQELLNENNELKLNRQRFEIEQDP
jgi:glycosyltransferase involved in cell wall biosynthesis